MRECGAVEAIGEGVLRSSLLRGGCWLLRCSCALLLRARGGLAVVWGLVVGRQGEGGAAGRHAAPAGGPLRSLALTELREQWPVPSFDLSLTELQLAACWCKARLSRKNAHQPADPRSCASVPCKDATPDT
jgi:hypothetical protein